MDDFYFNPTFIQGTPGQSLTLHLKNEGKNAHTFTSAALNVDKTLQPGQDMDVQVMLPQAGATEFHCNFHQSQGMQGAFFFKTGDAVGGPPERVHGARERSAARASSSSARRAVPTTTRTDSSTDSLPRVARTCVGSSDASDVRSAPR